MTIGPEEVDPRLIVLAFWRQLGDEIEFFIPINDDYLSVMQFPVLTRPAAAGRQSAVGRFRVNPRSNARVIVTNAGTMVVFCLTKVEADAIAHLGGWVPASAVSNDTGKMLQDLAARM
ncbi:MAG TPA: hypothetical protein VJM46_03575 [Candidatus Saccharimonadales bacterium]|nr:hypothetical protein [Candidatus Saccharimonadales bacterium]